MILYVVSIFYWKTCIYMYIYKKYIHVLVWYLYRLVPYYCLRNCFDILEIYSTKDCTQDASRMSCRSARMFLQLWKTNEGLILQTWIYHHQKWGEKSSLFLPKMETMEKNKLRLFFSPLSGPNFQARNLELVTQPMGPVPVPSSGFTLRNSHGHPMEDLGRSVFCHTPATFGNSGGVFRCVITFNLALQTHKSSHPPQVRCPAPTAPQCQQWQTQRRRTLHWYGWRYGKVCEVMPSMTLAVAAWYVN